MKRKFTLLTAVLMLLSFLALPLGMRGQDRTTVTDTLTRASTGVTGTSYASWSGVTSNSDAVYAGQSAGGNGSIQLRSNNNNSGIITTSSGGTVTSVSVTWNSNTTSNRTLNIYGSNSAYSSPTELYNSSTQGTLLGTIVCGTSTSLSIDGSYAYIGMRSASGAMYLEEIDITWSTGGSTTQTVATPTFTPAGGTYSETQYVAIECATQGASIYYTTDGSTPTPNSTPFTEAITISETTTLKAIAVKQGMNNSSVATATYTIQQLTSLTTIPAIWEFASSLSAATPASITFNNWYVTAVKSSNAYVSDGQYGLIIYQSSHGFSVGDQLSGTYTCNVTTYQGAAELTGVKASNLTVTPGQTIPELSIGIDSLAPMNYSTIVNLGTLTYDGTVFTDGNNNTITPYNTLNVSPNPISSLESGKQYTVKGMFLVYNQTKEIAPRSADDFEEVTNPTPTETVATPTFTPEGGTYYETQYVAIECATQGADIYYTTDGTTPSPNSTMFTEAITISETTTLKAIAVMQGMNDSEMATAEYIINIVPPAEETSYTLITNANALISGDKYIIVGVNNDTYKALGKQTTNNRSAIEVASSNDTITVTPANLPGLDAVYELTLGQDNGNWTFYSAADSGYLYAASSSSNWLRTQAQNDTNGQWTIEIATDGKATIIAQGANTRNSLKYNSGNSIFSCYAATSNQLQAYLYKAGDVPAPPAPTYYNVEVNFNEGGVISADHDQALENDTIHITVAPLPGFVLSSLTYSYTGASPIDIKATKWFLMPASDVTVQAIFDEVPHVDTPTFTPEEGTYAAAQTVTIACTTEGATIYYTMDGTDPIVAATGINGTQYLQPIVIGETTTLKAIAVKDGMMNSDIATATYTIEIPSLVFNKLYYHSDVTDEGTYMIVDVHGGSVLHSANGTSALPTADSVSIENNAIVGNIPEAWQWKIKAVDGGYQISPINDSTAYLYTTDANNGLRVGSSSNNVWELGITDATKPNYHGFKNVAFDRYLGVYNNQTWRTYTSVNNNIANTQIEIFVLGPAPVHTFYPVNVAAVTNGTVTVSDTVAEAGTVITVTAVPVAGYELATLTYSVTGANPVAIDQTTMQFTMPAAAVTVNATFTELAHVANPTFTPAAGSFITAQTVSIACATEGATIYYTTDGSDPTPNSLVFSEAFEVSETTTVKAIAVKDGMNNSDVASAIYTIIEPMSIAEARTLANNEYALVEGVVTFIDGRNVYIQDESAGIDLFLNSNTVPSNLALGDMVLCYGKKTVYNGLVELTGVNGGNANEFVVLSNGNELPVAVKTIAEILADYQSGANTLQSTRVQIVDATIGTINTANNTPVTQDGNTLNIYKMPAVEGLEEGDFVTVTGIIGCYNNPQLRVNSAEDVEFTHPAGITVTPASLAGFNYVYEEGPSTPKSFVITARSLTGATTILAPESYELSSFPGDNFYPQSEVNINSYSGNFTYTIKVRLKAGLEIGTYDESIMICNELLDTIYMALTGSVTAAPQPTSDYVRVTELSQLGNGSKVIFTARYNENANEYYAMTAQASGKPEGVLFTSVAGTDTETLPSEITDAEDTYYWTVTTDGTNYTFTNANGDVLGYTSSTNFATGGDNINWTITEGTSEATAMVPEYTAFNVINANVTNRAFALNSNHNYGAYHTQNMSGENYNFFVDMFTTSGTPVTPTCATPTFDPVGGTYFEEQTVTITCSTADATIYYTLDGSDPTPNSMVYSEPIEVAENTIIKAYAVKEGFNDSNIAEAEYTIILGAATIFFQDWEGEMNGWTFVNVEGNKPWTIGQYQGNHYAYGNGYNGGVNEQWCISPAFSLEQYSDVTLNFRNAMNYTGPDLELYFSNDYDGENPGNANWTELEFNKSNGSFAWAESGAIEFTGFTGTDCYIGFKYTSTENEAAAWEVDDILLMGYTSDPYLTVTPTSLTGFTHVVEGGPSASQTFILSGGNLPPAPGGEVGGVTITCDNTSFELSLDDVDYYPYLGIAVVGTLEPTTIYVRLNGEEVGSYEGIITLEDYATATVTLTGTVTEPIQGGDWNRIGSLADLHDGDQLVIAARYDATVGDGYYAMTAGVSGKPDGVLFTSVNEDGIETLPDEIVADITTFVWNVTVNDTIITLTNAAGDMLGYSSSTNFAGNTSTDWSISYATSGENAMVPNYTGFLITNVETNNRCIVMNANYKFGAYHTNNINSGDYNFYLDFFVQGGTATQTVATPVFSVASGTYFEEFDVEITCATEGAVIYYTTDGTDPNDESIVYEEPIHIDSDVTLKAIAMLEGYDDSNIATVNYVVMTGQAVILQQDWEGEMNGWTFVTIEGNKPWSIGTYGGNKYAYANGYNDDTDNEQWCISPAFDLTYYRDVVLTFRNAMKFTGPDMQLFFSSNYDGQNPSAATWTELDYVKSEGNYTWTESGEISLDGLQGKGNCYIAFLYTSNLDDGAAAWEVDDILILGTAYDAVEETALTDVNFWNYDNEIFVDNQTNGKVEMTVFNLLGQPVMAKTLSAGNVRLSHSLATGVYVVTLQNSKGRMAVKMIVK
ncbi:MAG: chitobiase/beta-hexosaminidase C-terminal domain-containing protein [Bacteroidales bacterium]|nr:chitobiase/beta-hexosaminidase C-terminal domain-containing protein [Bacteroidales bacterium]